MNVTEVLSAAKDAITVKRVYAEPYEKDGLTVIPAAVVGDGAGGGSGQDDKGQRGWGRWLWHERSSGWRIRHQGRPGRLAPCVRPGPDRRDGRLGGHRLLAQPATDGPCPGRVEISRSSIGPRAPGRL